MPVVAAICAVLLAGAGVQTFRLASERAAHAGTRVALAQAESVAREAHAANQRLAQTIATQNQALATLKQKADAKQAKATIVVREVLKKPPPAPTGTGPAVLNEFMGGVFGP